MKLKQVLEGRPIGHPIHPFFTHLPLGLWLFATILDIVSRAADEEQWALTGAYWCLLIGSSVAILVVITGFNDWLDIRADHPAQKSALWHMGLMLPATALFFVSTILHYAQLDAPRVGPVAMTISIVAYLLAIVGGYIGGRLVYDDGIAVGRHRRSTELPQNTIHEPLSSVSEKSFVPQAGLPSQYHPVIPAAALAEDSTLRVEIEGNIVLLAKTQDKIVAVQEFCTHRCGPLSEGTVCNGAVKCPWHGSVFDLATGKVLHGPAKVDLKTYEVRIDSGIIHVRIDAPASGARPESERAPERRNPADEGHTRESRDSQRRTRADKTDRA